MDGISGAEAASRLGTSIPRVARAASRLGFRSGSGRLSLTPEQYKALKAELGVIPKIEGLSTPEAKVLAALRLAPFGLVSARAVASRAGVSPTTASRTLQELARRNLVRREQRMMALGRARAVEVWHANIQHPDWTELAKGLAKAQPPVKSARRTPRGKRVPPRLRHLFWNVSPTQLDIDAAGPSIARRLLRTEDPEGLAWGVEQLKPGDWREGARARGLDPGVRAMAENLAGHGS
jgi:MarR family